MWWYYEVGGGSAGFLELYRKESKMSGLGLSYELCNVYVRISTELYEVYLDAAGST